MALSEQEELELLELEREQSMGSQPQPSQADVRKAERPEPPPPSVLDQATALGKKAFAMTPFGVAARGMDAAGELLDRAAYDAGGAVTDQAAKVLPAEQAAAAGYAANVATQAIPTVLSGNPAKALGGPLKAAGERVMQGALKPGVDALTSGKAAQAITTMLEEGVNVSKGGVQKLYGMIDDLNGEITKAIVNSPATVHKGQVARTLIDTVKQFRNQVTPTADLKAIRAAWQDFMNHPLLKSNDIPVQVAQDLKQGTYRVLRSKAYGELKGADTEAQKALARGLKEGIAAKVPGVGALNAQESQLLNALELNERRALMELNKNPAGLSWLARTPEAAVGFMADRSAVFKSLLARMLYSGQEQIPATVARLLTGAGVAANNAPERK